MQDLGFLAFTLPQVAILMPTKQPRGAELTLEGKRINQALNHRRLRIEHGNSSVKRCRIVKDRIRLWKAASVIWSWNAAVPCIISGCVLPLGSRWFNRDKVT